jgi:large subunit ribosomal protein L30
MAAPKSKTSNDDAKALLVTYTRSAIGRSERQRRTIRALGLRKLHQTVQHRDTADMRAMIGSVQHLVTVREIESVPPVAAQAPAESAPTAASAAASEETVPTVAEVLSEDPAAAAPKRTRTRKASTDETA